MKGFAKYGFWNRFHRLCAKDGHTISIKDKLTVFERIPADDTVARELQIDVGTPVLHIVRIIWSDIHQRKSGIDEIFLRADHFEALQEKHILEKEPTVALYAMYELVCGVITQQTPLTLSTSKRIRYFLNTLKNKVSCCV